MRIAYLVLCHKSPTQLASLISCLDNNDDDFYIHVDKKSNVQLFMDAIDNNHTYFVDDEDRINVKWGHISQVLAIIALIKKSFNTGKYDYYWLISGQDFPIKSTTQIHSFFDFNKTNVEYIDFAKDHTSKFYNDALVRTKLYYPGCIVKNTFASKVIRRLYKLITLNGQLIHRNQIGTTFEFGSEWWTLSSSCVEYVLQYIKGNPNYIKFYQNALCPDESFFQTIVVNSSFGVKVKPNLAYIDWSECNSNPSILTLKDFNVLIDSDKLIARKFDENVDNEVLVKLNDFISKQSKE